MQSPPDVGRFGWDDQARIFLILASLISGVGLAWASSGVDDSRLEWPTISVDANTAPEPVLGALPGLGPVLSARIVAARQARPFDSLEDFDRRVKGIGPSKVAALRPYLRFEVLTAPQP